MSDSPKPTSSGPERRSAPLVFAIVLSCFFLALAVIGMFRVGHASGSEATAANADARKEPDVLVLPPEQLAKLDLGKVEQKRFEQLQDAIGIIDFNQDRALPVFSPYQGRIGSIRVRAGDNVLRGQVLYTVLIPDIAQAASTLVSAAATLRNANTVLDRAKLLRETDSVPQKEYEQNLADQQSADVAYQSARKSMVLFGLTEAEITHIETTRDVSAEMPVRSPLAGRVTTRMAAEGVLVQPGNAPAPVTVADMSTLWMIASVPESDIAAYQKGQSVAVRVPAYPNKPFTGHIDYIADAVDPNTHRVAVRAEIPDGNHQLKPQMTASFKVTVGAAQQSPAVPEDALVREGDGSTSAWVADDSGHLHRRVVKTGLRQDGWVQIAEGLNVGETIARTNAIFLSSLNSNTAR